MGSIEEKAQDARDDADYWRSVERIKDTFRSKSLVQMYADVDEACQDYESGLKFSPATLNMHYWQAEHLSNWLSREMKNMEQIKNSLDEDHHQLMDLNIGLMRAAYHRVQKFELKLLGTERVGYSYSE